MATAWRANGGATAEPASVPEMLFEPPRIRLSATLGAAVAPRQAKRMKLPGAPHAIAIFDADQIPLAGALIARHPEAELWSFAGPEPQADFTLDVAAASDLRPAWERMERLGIESGRLGSESLG